MNAASPWFGRLQYLVWILFGVLLVAWLALTPPGLLGKADAVGYAVCHRIAERSYFLGERALPLCSRCSGMYLGALAGFVYQFALGKRGGQPSRRVQILLGLFLLAFAVDGVNSYLTFFPGAPNLYLPHNSLRLLTGTLVGVGIAALLLPTFHQLTWRVVDERAALPGFRQLLLLLGLAGLISAAITSENPLIVYPLALLSTGSLLVILVLAYSIGWTMILKRDNSFERWQDLGPVLALAMLTTLVQIGVIDLIRYALTGSWNGFSL